MGALLALALLCACTSAGKRETIALGDAMDRFRAGDDAQKPAAAALVRGVACTDAEVCDAKARCVEAVDATTRALALKAEVEARLADVEAKKIAPDDPVARALPKKLDDSERSLREGRTAMHDCEAKIGALRLKHGA